MGFWQLVSMIIFGSVVALLVFGGLLFFFLSRMRDEF